MRQLTLPSEIVKKSNPLARARWSAESVWEPRLVALLASKVQENDTDFQIYEIPASEIMHDHGGKDYIELEQVVDKVMSRVLTIRDDKGWTKYNVFSRCRFRKKDGILELGFHPDLRPHYLNLKKNFAQYKLLEFLMLPSVYSQRLFEFLKSWDDRQDTVIALSELHKMLNTPDSLRKNFKNLRIRVLEKAHKDITEHTDLRYEWEAIKQGRAVVAICFIFGKARALPIAKQKAEADATKDKQREKNNAMFKAAIACFQERGAACEGGYQKDEICVLCQRLR